MAQKIAAYIRTQAAATAVLNAVLNPAAAWIGNRQMDFIPLRSDGNNILINVAITSLVLSLLVTLFAAAGLHRDLQAGKIALDDAARAHAGSLAHLPRRAWAFGLFIGVCAAVILTPLTFGLFAGLGIAGLSFPAFAFFIAVYGAALGALVARLAIRRQWLLESDPAT